MTLKEFLENNKEELIYDFVNNELKKTLARSKELNKKNESIT